MTRRIFASSAAGAWAAQAQLKLPRAVRIVIIGTEGHPSEILEPAPRIQGLEIAAQVKGGADFRPVLDRVKPDLVAVCNTDGQRAGAVLECVRRGLPFIAEKPLAIHRADFDRIRAGVEKARLKHSMLLPLRFTPQFQMMHELGHSGELGDVAQIGGQKSYKKGDSVGWRNKAATFSGTIPWVGIHMVDLMRWTSGRDFTEGAAFQAHVGMPEIGERDNSAGVLFRMDNGGVATLRIDYLRPDSALTHGDDRLRLAGTRGVAEYMEATGVTLMKVGEKPKTITALPAPKSLFVEFLKALYLGAPDPVSQDDIWRANIICLRAREAAESGRLLKLS